ncbi:MAG: hypothetical protein KJ077_12410 [Anaerolineae bacterium]|nr:hypothetical protein [Anaerolineae bacterium]
MAMNFLEIEQLAYLQEKKRLGKPFTGPDAQAWNNLHYKRLYERQRLIDEAARRGEQLTLPENWIPQPPQSSRDAARDQGKGGSVVERALRARYKGRSGLDGW